MKSTNIINSISPQQQQSVQRWLYITFFLFLNMTILFLYIEIPYLLNLYQAQQSLASLHKQTSFLTPLQEQKNNLKEEEKHLCTYKTKIHRILSKEKIPSDFIMFFNKSGKKYGEWRSMYLHHKKVTLSMLCNSIEEVHSLYEALKTISLSVTIQSIQQQLSTNKKRYHVQFYCIPQTK